ncbi:MAG: hypothetical protein GF341_08095 [candidate division Zixibacteria bacterium]|nr:hypothetical protein [candidate division Zixibacteria bacterium]
MNETIRIGDTTVRLIKGDITDQEIEAFVYYARHNLALGSGFGTAITVRGGPDIQKELDTLGPIETTEVVVSNAGELKADKIIHAVGPRFQEVDLPAKLATTIRNCLSAAREHDISSLAFPPMGVGFYGVPLDLCARIMLATFQEVLRQSPGMREIVICANDSREYEPFRQLLQNFSTTKEYVQ